jgi:hypothetical protein
VSNYTAEEIEGLDLRRIKEDSKDLGVDGKFETALTDR